ncbi:MAG: hypothetical protein U0736_27550 [Gemmataceae bacterium]
MTKTKGLVLVALAGALLWFGALQLRVRAAEQQARDAAERQRAEVEEQRQRVTAEMGALRAQFEALKRENADLKAALRAVREGPGQPGAPGLVRPVAPRVRQGAPAGPPEAELLKHRVEAKRAELEAARLSAEEARRRVDRVATLAKAARASEEEVGAARVTAARAQAEARVREAELAEILTHLKFAEQHAAPHRPDDAPAHPPAERRSDEVQERFRKLEQAIDQIRRELKERREH